MTLELRNLRYLVALSRRLSYARAAEDLGITQSALSRSIQTLEEQFAVRLFDRGRSGVTPTSAGIRIVERAQALLANASDLERSFREEAAGESGTLNIGMTHVPARALLASSLALRLRDAPSVRNNVVVRGMDALWPLLVAGEAEFLVAPTRLLPDSPPVRTESLGQFPVSLVVRPNHPLMLDGNCEPRFPFLTSNESFTARVAPSELLSGAKGPLHIVEDFDTLIHLTSSTDAIWLTSAFAVAGELARGELCRLRSPRRQDHGYFDIAFLSLDRRSQSPAAQHMKQALRKRFHSLTRDAAGRGD
jgi:DNA-binding transcriptional LysR family regulator